jgi:hypothetical protein
MAARAGSEFGGSRRRTLQSAEHEILGRHFRRSEQVQQVTLHGAYSKSFSAPSLYSAPRTKVSPEARR